jgi:oligopeptide transport system substrate-binding protein
MTKDALQRCAQDCAERAWRLAYALMHNGHDAEDVVQEAFVVAARRRDRIPTDDPWPWFATVVTNVARNARRSRRKHMHDDPPDFPARSTNADLSVLVAEALAQLPEPERDAVACTHLSGLTQAQAAEALDVPVGTVATRVRSGLAKLRHKLGRREEEVALGIGVMFIPLPAGGMQVSTERWLHTAADRASEDSPNQGERMRSKLIVAGVAMLAMAVLVWLAAINLGERTAGPGPGGISGMPPDAPGAGSANDVSPLPAGRENPAAANEGEGTVEESGGPEQVGPVETVAKDNVLRLGFGSIETLDAMKSTSVASGVCIELAYESLFEIDPFDFARTRPLIAAGHAAFNADVTTAQVAIRRDVCFADDPCFPEGKGRALVAEDVVYSLKRAMVVSPRGSSLVELVRKLADGESIRALDNYTIEVALTERGWDFERTLEAFPIMAREAVEFYGDGISEHMVGTGPYVLEQRTATSVIFVRNPNYRDVRLTDVPVDSPLKSFEGSRLPLADRVEVALGESRFEQLLEGRLSIIPVQNDELLPMLEEGELRLTERWRNAGLKLFTQVTDGSHIVEFDMRNPTIGAPGGEKARALRRAISTGFDRQAWTDSALGYNGFASDSMVPPGTVVEVSGNVPKADVETARRLLADAGFLLHADGDAWVAIDPDTGKQPELTFTLRGDSPSSIKKGEVMRELGRQIGVKIEVEQPANWNAFVELRMNKDGKGHMFDMGWSGGGSNPGDRYELYTSDIEFSSFRNAEYDGLVPKLQGFLLPGTHEYREALEALARVVEILETEAPVFVIAYTRSLAVGRADLVRPTLPAGVDTHRKYWGFTGQ